MQTKTQRLIVVSFFLLIIVSFILPQFFLLVSGKVYIESKKQEYYKLIEVLEKELEKEKKGTDEDAVMAEVYLYYIERKREKIIKELFEKKIKKDITIIYRVIDDMHFSDLKY